MKRHDKPADYDRYTGYMDARVLIEGLRAAGPSVTRASLVAAMQGLGNLDLGGYVYQFSAQNHHGANFVDIAAVGSGGCTGNWILPKGCDCPGKRCGDNGGPAIACFALQCPTLSTLTTPSSSAQAPPAFSVRAKPASAA